MLGLSSWAVEHERTTDHIEISQVVLNPGGAEGYFVVSLKGDRIYTACGMDIIIPDGYEYSIKSNGEAKVTYSNEKKQGMYPVTNQDEVDEEDADPEYNSHVVDWNIIAPNTLRVTPWSTRSIEFAKTSGKMFRVYVKAKPFVKPGPADVQVKKCFFTTSEGVQYNADDITISDKMSASTSGTAPMAVSALNKWSTCILPFDTELPEGVKAYTCSSKDEEAKQLILTPASSISAYTPYILYSETGFSGNLTGTVDASKYPETGYVESGLLCGAVTEKEIAAGYVMQNLDGTGAKFYSMGGNDFIIPAGKCWVKFFFSNAKMFSMLVMDDTTAVNGVSFNKQNARTTQNIMGQMVSNNYRGIIIVDGKKYIKK